MKTRNRKSRYLMILPVVLALTLSGPATAISDPGESAVKKSFEKFVSAWMGKLDRIGKKNIQTLVIVPGSQGFVGRYINYGPEYEFSIKKTGSPETPFVGFIHYTEKHFLKRGQTKQKTIQDAGRLTNKIPVIEIFRFTRGKWVY